MQEEVKTTEYPKRYFNSIELAMLLKMANSNAFAKQNSYDEFNFENYQKDIDKFMKILMIKHAQYIGNAPTEKPMVMPSQ